MPAVDRMDSVELQSKLDHHRITAVELRSRDCSQRGHLHRAAINAIKVHLTESNHRDSFANEYFRRNAVALLI